MSDDFCPAFGELDNANLSGGTDCLRSLEPSAGFEDWLRHTQSCESCMQRKALAEARVIHVHACPICRAFALRHPYLRLRYGLAPPEESLSRATPEIV